MRAVDTGAVATAIALNSVLNLPVVKRLGLGSSENEALRNKAITNFIGAGNSIHSRLFEQDGLPYLDAVLDQLKKEYHRKVGSEFEKE